MHSHNLWLLLVLPFSFSRPSRGTAGSVTKSQKLVKFRCLHRYVHPVLIAYCDLTNSKSSVTPILVIPPIPPVHEGPRLLDRRLVGRRLGREKNGRIDSPPSLPTPTPNIFRWQRGLKDTNKGNWMTMFIHFSCLCPLGLTIKLNLIYRKWPGYFISHGKPLGEERRFILRSLCSNNLFWKERNVFITD